MRTFQGKVRDSSFIIEHSAGLVASVHFSIEITSAIEVIVIHELYKHSLTY